MVLSSHAQAGRVKRPVVRRRNDPQPETPSAPPIDGLRKALGFRRQDVALFVLRILAEDIDGRIRNFFSWNQSGGRG